MELIEYLLVVIAILLFFIIIQATKTFWEVKETNKLLYDFLYHYHKYEGKKWNDVYIVVKLQEILLKHGIQFIVILLEFKEIFVLIVVIKW